MHPWTYYLDKVKKLVEKYDNPYILKTDCNNEAEGRPLPGGIAFNVNARVQMIEYDRRTIDNCKRKYPGAKVDQGDIRDLPYEDSTFDIVLDLSTIDHIPQKDIERTISEYHRVTKDYLLLIIWYGERDLVDRTNTKKFDPANQYYFDQEETREILDKYFTTQEEDYNFYNHGRSWLGYHLLKK